MALAQCRGIIAKHGFSREAVTDTAGAAKDVAVEGDRSVAAIASRLAAETYGLEILAENIEDAEHNTTRFLIMSREPQTPAYDPGQPYLTTIVFEVRSVPAALYKAMGGFATNGINLTKLESYLVGGTLSASSSTRTQRHISTIRGCKTRWKSCVTLARKTGFRCLVSILLVSIAKCWSDLARNETNEATDHCCH